MCNDRSSTNVIHKKSVLSNGEWKAATGIGGSVPIPRSADKEESTRARANWMAASGRDRIYEPFFLRSAQRFFIASDSRLLPSGVSPPRFFPFNAGGGGVATPVLTARGEFDLSSTAMARLSLSLSCFKSATILCRSTIGSFLYQDGVCRRRRSSGSWLPQRGRCSIYDQQESPARAGILRPGHCDPRL